VCRKPAAGAAGRRGAFRRHAHRKAGELFACFGDGVGRVDTGCSPVEFVDRQATGADMTDEFVDVPRALGF